MMWVQMAARRASCPRWGSRSAALSSRTLLQERESGHSGHTDRHGVHGRARQMWGRLHRGADREVTVLQR